MRVELITFYLLAIGTSLALAGLTLWESRVHPKRARTLRMLALGYAAWSMGCGIAAMRDALPGLSGWAVSNLVIVSGYLLALRGAGELNGRRETVAPVVILLAAALTWVIGGEAGRNIVWNYVSALPISAAAGMTCFVLLGGARASAGRARQFAACVAGFHAVLYLFRGAILPWIVGDLGMPFLVAMGRVTMYEGVLYSVILPMALLRIVREESHAALVQETRTDFLTALGNRRWFFEEGARVMAAAGARPVSLLAFDLDRFKGINDRYGHESGDDVLRAFADVVRERLPDALLARIGGEEFVALLPGHDLAGASRLGETVASAFANRGTLHRLSGAHIRATVSVGVALHQGGAHTLADLLAAADHALYAAKRRGGNRVEQRGDPRAAREVATGYPPAHAATLH